MGQVGAESPEATGQQLLKELQLEGTELSASELGIIAEMLKKHPKAFSLTVRTLGWQIAEMNAGQ